MGRGSTWNKWDFHVHTPYSVLNNQYGFVPETEYSCDTTKKFDEYVKKLFTRAVENGIVAIGITDYFSIDGYKRIRSEYLEKTEEMEKLFPDEVLRSKIEKIYVFPNIEFRIPIFIGKNAKSVNYHVIFSDDVSIQDIETAFLSQLHLKRVEEGELPLCRTSIERIGAEYKKYNRAIGSDYYVGLEHITVDEEKIQELLSNVLFKEKHLISIPVDEELSSVKWDGRDHILRKVLYRHCHCFMTSNEKTRKWALGSYGEEAQAAEFGALKPCIWGSDAHSYEQMFCSAEERYCWIKAEPTFEGLRQILYEPSERVKIQKDRPEEKDTHQIIDFIRFHNDDFQIEPIFLSEGLITIIGGKSTGKSILLRHIAKGIDSKQVEEREKDVFESDSKLNLNVEAEVVWKDGASGERKIIYIPQSWLNHIVDERTEKSQLNKMLEGILLQQKEINDAYMLLSSKVKEIIESIRHNILEYVMVLEKAKECEEYLHDFGRSTVFQSAIEKLEKRREELSVEAGITDIDMQTYTELEKEVIKYNDLLVAIEEEKARIDLKNPPFVFIPQITTLDSSSELPKYRLDTLPTIKNKIAEAIQKINQAILVIWQPTIHTVQETIEERKIILENMLREYSIKFQKVQEVVSRSDQLQEIESKLKNEKDKLQEAKLREDTQAENLSQAKKLMEQILISRQVIFEVYNAFAVKVSQTNVVDSDLEFSAEVRIRKRELFEAISSLFDNRNLRSFKEKYEYDIRDEDELIIDDGLFKSIWEAMLDGTLSFKGGNTFQTVLERLFSDWFYVHYVVKSGRDTISSMSPGNKALVLLEMIVNLEKSNCPILIDQPEDDLDNRSIYTDLVTYLKTKKHERQIIVVTHNANIVVGADAEEVIIANQDGKETPNLERRFEYRSGSIETLTPVYGENNIPLEGILNKKGIQEQICDILEGGKDAFEKRSNKYMGTRVRL